MASRKWGRWERCRLNSFPRAVQAKGKADAAPAGWAYHIFCFLFLALYNISYGIFVLSDTSDRKRFAVGPGLPLSL